MESTEEYMSRVIREIEEKRKYENETLPRMRVATFFGYLHAHAQRFPQKTVTDANSSPVDIVSFPEKLDFTKVDLPYVPRDSDRIGNIHGSNRISYLLARAGLLRADLTKYTTVNFSDSFEIFGEGGISTTYLQFSGRGFSSYHSRRLTEHASGIESLARSSRQKAVCFVKDDVLVEFLSGFEGRSHRTIRILGS